jgi:ferredoxin
MNQFLQLGILIADLFIVAIMLLGLNDSINEHETRPAAIMLLGFIGHIALIPVILYMPRFEQLVLGYFGIMGLVLLVFLLPAKPNKQALLGSRGYVKSEVERVDERDIVFARNKLKPGTPQYDEYYATHPELKEVDDEIRIQRSKRQLGKIDGGHPSNVSMIHANHFMSPVLGKVANAIPDDGSERKQITTEKATQVLKGLALHLGACNVGACEVNPDVVYSHMGEIHYGNWDDWGKPFDDIPPYALVFATEMNYDNVASAPHTPESTESSNNYAKGAYISTLISRWFKSMGYIGLAQHQRHYDVITPALALDAGLGEVGRQGYLITPRQGARVRVFAVLTDMPLKSDKPISFGVDEFCVNCIKCAETCPSESIPLGEKTIHNGVEKWKLEAESCFKYWGEVGTDCGICMACCPFSRPDTLFHNIIRWFIAHSHFARIYFPYIEYALYGKEWKPKPVPKWLDYRS